MHWSLDQLRALDAYEYAALIEWAKERAKPKDEDGSVDMDAVIDAKKKKDEQDAG